MCHAGCFAQGLLINQFPAATALEVQGMLPFSATGLATGLARVDPGSKLSCHCAKVHPRLAAQFENSCIFADIVFECPLPTSSRATRVLLKLRLHGQQCVCTHGWRDQTSACDDVGFDDVLEASRPGSAPRGRTHGLRARCPAPNQLTATCKSQSLGPVPQIL